MDIEDKVVAVTGAGGGIGRAMAEAFAKAGARHVVVSDRDGAAAKSVADSIGGSSFACDVSRRGRSREDHFGDRKKYRTHRPLLLERRYFTDQSRSGKCSVVTERGVAARLGGERDVARVCRARAAARDDRAPVRIFFEHRFGGGPALSQIGSAAYATTKHAAIGFAENLALTHKDHGIKVSVLCPQAVSTAMTDGKALNGADVDGVLSAEQVAQSALAGIASETFLILPHANVAKYYAMKSESYDRWIAGMAKLRRALTRGAA